MTEVPSRLDSRELEFLLTVATLVFGLGLIALAFRIISAVQATPGAGNRMPGARNCCFRGRPHARS